MTAGKDDQNVGTERRIIERPRLIKLLDESDARIILLLAPAGYGKTTLARQWAKTLNRAIWVTFTPAHRDVVTFAEDIATGIESLGGSATEFIREYLRAQSNPQRSAHGVALELSKQMNDVGVQWLILDDCHEIAEATEAVAMVSKVLERLHGRMLVSSRARPSWITSRHLVYGEVHELQRADLAMTKEEADEILGPRTDLGRLAHQAEGWPAVIGLAAALEGAVAPEDAMPDALHHYLAEELFQSAPAQLRDDLIALALLPHLDADLLTAEFGERRGDIIDEARRLGFVNDNPRSELHPLLREFLLLKLLERADAEERVRRTIRASVEACEWEHALGLVLRFSLADQIDPVLSAAFTPLARRGLIGTLSTFAAQVRLDPTFAPATVDLVDAEVALREGHLELAIDLAGRAYTRLGEGHTLRSRAKTIIGQSHYLVASYDEAEAAFTAAREEATDVRDAAEAIHGLVLAKVFGERGDVRPALKALSRLRHESPLHLLRYATAELNRRRFAEGLALRLDLDAALHTFPRVDDPRARTSFTYSVAYSFALRAEYEEAKRFLSLCLDDIRSFDLEFALPYANWTAAMISLGLRRFGEAERSLQGVEDASKSSREQGHAVNARSLRARMLLETGQPAEALLQVQPDVAFRLIPSWLGEYLATRALVLACVGRSLEAQDAAQLALHHSGAAEVRVLAASARAICALTSNDSSAALTLAKEATAFGVWDPVVCALRSSPLLADAFASEETLRPTIESLYLRSRDRGLARRAGFRTRSSHSPDDLLSPRELEVLGLISRGLRNHEISNALFIADSTTKVHVRHILEKLGVRTRAEAVARYEMFATAKGADTA
ncbi:MAG TPA: LuxR C-terminal-related transcriptional regulator [Microbacteriaceae bacterium]|nr:LuxR C-terminal-related transcriptional regulator [Microbacteriaceae bacterium]